MPFRPVPNSPAFVAAALGCRCRGHVGKSERADFATDVFIQPSPASTTYPFTGATRHPPRPHAPGTKHARHAPPPRSKPQPGHQTRSKGDNFDKSKVGTLKTTKYQVLPPPTREHLASLRASIAARGVDEAIVVDENDAIIDGTQRYNICQELGIFCPRQVRHFGSEAEKYELALTRNCTRRQLDRTAKRALIGTYLRVDPQICDNLLASIIGGIGSHLVARVRNELVGAGEIREYKKLRGRDGHYRPKKYAKVLANSPAELAVAQQAVLTLPAACEGKYMDTVTAARRSRKEVSQRAWKGKLVLPTSKDAIRLYNCPFQELETTARLRSHAANLILTDIPYTAPFLDQLDDLGAFAQRMLIDGGVFITHSGQMHLNRVIRSLDRHLTYRWTMASVWSSGANWVHPLNVTNNWTAILVYSAGDWKDHCRWPDLFHSEREKHWHEWQKPLAEVESLIKYFSEPGQLVLDPCGGGFTSAVAARNLGRRFVGCDIDRECVVKGQERLAAC